MRQISKILYFIVIMVFMVPVANVEANEKAALQKKFYKWINERVKLEKEQHGFHREAHENKLGEKQRMNIPEGKYNSNELTFDDTFLAPDDPELWPLWRDWLDQWRKDKRKALAYDDSYYSNKAFDWVPSNYVSGFIMLWDMTLLDPVEGRYMVKEFIEHAKKEFGGYDSVVLWLAYPILGICERNQSDMYRDMPGGLEGMRDLVKAFHKHGIEVFIPFQPWDDATRQEDKTDAEVLLSITEAINADGIYLDTWYECAPLRLKLDEIRPGLVIDTELPIPIEYVAEHHMSWAQSKPWRQWLFEDGRAPGVLKSKWFERRHVVRPTNRWEDDCTDELQVSWMNGTGTLIWENRFGCWNGWNKRSRSILRSMIPVQRRYVDLFTGEKWTPLVEHRGEDVFASLWEGHDLRLWTLINRANEPYRGNLLAIRHNQGVQYFDLIKGMEANVKLEKGVAYIDGEIDAMGIGGFLAIPEKEVTRNFNKFLSEQAEIFENRNWDSTFPEGKNQVLTPVTRTKEYDKDNPPANMAAICSTTVELERSFNEGAMPQGFNTLPEKQKVELSAYAIDLTPVTNAEYEKFLEASGYKPRIKKNFLKHWVDGKPPVGKEDHPVVYVDLVDARAYANWAGKRLPTDAEWQYAAEGPKHLKYPWGNKEEWSEKDKKEWSEKDKMKKNLCNGGQSGGTTSVYAFPDGRSPFGCYDMCGNTWEWTESEQTDDGRTRYCLVRGGSYFKAGGSDWYIDGGPQPCNRATKLLLVWPGLDRCSTIGFRCVVDLD
ncbi:MAG: formylglycine-generating enzyme family protein [Planctomycetota bacterium]